MVKRPVERVGQRRQGDPGHQSGRVGGIGERQELQRAHCRAECQAAPQPELRHQPQHQKAQSEAHAEHSGQGQEGQRQAEADLEQIDGEEIAGDLGRHHDEARMQIEQPGKAAGRTETHRRGNSDGRAGVTTLAGSPASANGATGGAGLHGSDPLFVEKRRRPIRGFSSARNSLMTGSSRSGAGSTRASSWISKHHGHRAVHPHPVLRQPPRHRRRGLDLYVPGAVQHSRRGAVRRHRDRPLLHARRAQPRSCETADLPTIKAGFAPIAESFGMPGICAPVPRSAGSCCSSRNSIIA